MKRKYNTIINNNNNNLYIINNYITHLLFSPIFPYLPFILGIFIFLSLKYYEPAYLCDGESIEELKNKLSEEITRYNETMEEMRDLKKKMHVAEEETRYDDAFYFDYKSE